MYVHVCCSSVCFVPSWWHNYDFDERDCLGAGAYGAVYKVTHRVDGVEYAMKIIKVPSRSVTVSRKFLQSGEQV